MKLLTRRDLRTSGLAYLLLIFTFIFLLAACGGNHADDTLPPATETKNEIPVASEAPMSEDGTGVTDIPLVGTGSVSFANQVRPILQEYCAKCHGGDRTDAGLNVLNYAALMAGGEDGLVVIPGDAAASLFITLVADQKMPKSGPKLTPEQVQVLTDWVNQGALDN